MLEALPIGRRRALLGLAAAATMTAPRGAAAAPAMILPDGATLLVAGPAGGRTDRWAELLSPALGRALQLGTEPVRVNVGGADGVTGANQFEARAAPDGSTALVVPGLAALSWLGGDTRVKFDAARWVPVWANSGPAALASRVRLAPGRKLRLAAASVVGPEMPALLALDLMGIEAVPVPPAESPVASLARPDIDAVLLSGPGLAPDMALLAAGGMPPVLTLGVLNPAGQTLRDPAFPDLQSAPEAVLRARPDAPPELLNALRAATTATQMEVALVLPSPSPAAMVALWRRGCAALAHAPEVQAEAARSLVRPASAAGAVVATASITADVPTLLELRRWLAARYGWQPS